MDRCLLVTMVILLTVTCTSNLAQASVPSCVFSDQVEQDYIRFFLNDDEMVSNVSSNVSISIIKDRSLSLVTNLIPDWLAEVIKVW